MQNLVLLGEVVPPDHTGQMLVTTQLRATGAVGPGLVVEPLDAEEGALLLLRKSRLVGPAGVLSAVAPTERASADQLVTALGGLPLALDQAGPYLEESGCGLADYLALYQRHQAALLARRGEASAHPEPVTTTLALALAQVAQACPAAADLLQLCAFLAPEAIPEDLFTAGGADLPEPLQPLAADELGWQETCAVALRSSLLARQPATQTLSLHRLVQVVLREALGEAQRPWAERVVRLVERAFPHQRVEYANWEHCQRLLPHALACAELIAQYAFSFPEAADLLYGAGRYLTQRGVYGAALPLLQGALALREQTLGPTHPGVTQSLSGLATLYYALGQYAQASPLYQRALAIDEQALGPTHPNATTDLNNLADLYREQRQYAQALPLFQRALTLREQVLGPTHPDVAQTLHALARLAQDQGQYQEALPLFLQALTIWEQAVGPAHPEVATNLHRLALLYRALGQDEEAFPLLERALAIWEQALGLTHPRVASCLEEYTTLLRAHQQPAQAEALEARAHAIGTLGQPERRPKARHQIAGRSAGRRRRGR